MSSTSLSRLGPRRASSITGSIPPSPPISPLVALLLLSRSPLSEIASEGGGLVVLRGEESLLSEEAFEGLSTGALYRKGEWGL